MTGADQELRNSIGDDLNKLSLKFESTVYAVVAINYGDFDAGKAPVWMAQLGIADTADNLAEALAPGFLFQNLETLPKFNIFRVKVGFNLTTRWLIKFEKRPTASSLTKVI